MEKNVNSSFNNQLKAIKDDSSHYFKKVMGFFMKKGFTKTFEIYNFARNFMTVKHNTL